MASRSASFADLLLAFRQAKKAIATERGGVGLFNLAHFEMYIATRIRQLRRLLRNDRWFDAIDLGSLVVMPKSVNPISTQKPNIVRVGEHCAERVKLGVRLQLEPSPEFTIAEVLYLWEFGGALEALLDRESCVGYRLRRVRKDGVLSREAGEVYDDWTKAFQGYRDDPIRVGAMALQEGKRIVITSTDVASFFDSLNPSFLLEKSFIAQLREAASQLGRSFSLSRYRTATKSLLNKYQEFRYLRRSVAGAGVDVEIGVPIGALTSRVFANVALSSLDTYIIKRPGVILYRRYVDDIVIVSASEPNLPAPRSRDEVLKELFPGFAEQGKMNS
ncbi:MAG: hypothetical protein DMF61_27145 [Blastocatellia bacterium AA13]|nr:MAG: hypothetical protein DMF61_27145 [Blastocatellia bacterium AA13]